MQVTTEHQGTDKGEIKMGKRRMAQLCGGGAPRILSVKEQRAAWEKYQAEQEGATLEREQQQQELQEQKQPERKVQADPMIREMIKTDQPVVFRSLDELECVVKQVVRDVMEELYKGHSVQTLAHKYGVKIEEVRRFVKDIQNTYMDVYIDGDALNLDKMPKVLSTLEVRCLRYVNECCVFRSQQGGFCKIPDEMPGLFVRSLGKSAVPHKNSIDMQITVKLSRELYRGSLMKTVVIVACDADFVPVIEELRRSSVQVLMVYREDTTSKTVLEYLKRSGVYLVSVESLVEAPKEDAYRIAENLNRLLKPEELTEGEIRSARSTVLGQKQGFFANVPGLDAVLKDMGALEGLGWLKFTVDPKALDEAYERYALTLNYPKLQNKNAEAAVVSFVKKLAIEGKIKTTGR